VNAYTKRPKRRVIRAPKFYFADVGVVNHLARRGYMASGSELFGKAFESWVQPCDRGEIEPARSPTPTSRASASDEVASVS